MGTLLTLVLSCFFLCFQMAVEHRNIVETTFWKHSFETVFPAGKKVRVQGLLNAPELNGVTGVVAGGGHYTSERVGVTLPEPHGLKALKLANIEIV